MNKIKKLKMPVPYHGYTKDRRMSCKDFQCEECWLPAEMKKRANTGHAEDYCLFFNLAVPKKTSSCYVAFKHIKKLHKLEKLKEIKKVCI